jgi:hypothetical protein
MAFVEAAIPPQIPLSVLVFERWSLAAEWVAMARSRKKDWLSLLQKHRNLETNRGVLQDAAGHPLRLGGPHLAVADLGPRLPPPA